MATKNDKALFRMTPQTLSEVTVETVNGRDLHRFLGIKTKYAMWIVRALDAANMIENKDYLVFPKIGKNHLGPMPKIEYHLTQRCCEHIGMMADEDKGQQIRDYFIAERDARIAQLKAEHERDMQDGLVHRFLLDTPSDYVNRFKGRLAARINALNENTRNGKLTFPDDFGSERVAGVMPTRIREMYNAFLGTKLYAEVKRRAEASRAKEKGKKAKANHQMVEDTVMVAMCAFMEGLSLGATCEQHYLDMLDVTTNKGGRQLLLVPWGLTTGNDAPVETA